jgi:hypothetical protein
VRVNIRACLTIERIVTIAAGQSITIPGTIPSALPWGQYTEISRKASHWKYNIWVEEIEEALLEPVL